VSINFLGKNSHDASSFAVIPSAEMRGWSNGMQDT
jgi:hypothetical protein